MSERVQHGVHATNMHVHGERPPSSSSTHVVCILPPPTARYECGPAGLGDGSSTDPIIGAHRLPAMRNHTERLYRALVMKADDSTNATNNNSNNNRSMVDAALHFGTIGTYSEYGSWSLMEASTLNPRDAPKCVVAVVVVVVVVVVVQPAPDHDHDHRCCACAWRGCPHHPCVARRSLTLTAAAAAVHVHGCRCAGTKPCWP